MSTTLLCWKTRNILDLFIDGRLAHDQEDAVAEHLTSCVSCREEADVLRPLPLLKSARPAAPAGLAAAILKKLEEGTAPDLAPAWRLSPAHAAGLAVLALLLLAHAKPGPVSQGLKAATKAVSR